MRDLFVSASSILMLACVGSYILKLFFGSTKAAPTTWGIALIAMTLNGLTYYKIVNGAWRELILPGIMEIAILTILIRAIQKGDRKKLSGIEKLCILIGGSVVITWTISNARIANILVQIMLITSFIPTIEGLIKGYLRDHPLPWLLAVSSYVFQIALVTTNPEEWSWYALLFPICNGILGNGSIAVAAWWRNHKDAVSISTIST